MPIYLKSARARGNMAWPQEYPKGSGLVWDDAAELKEAMDMGIVPPLGGGGKAQPRPKAKAKAKKPSSAKAAYNNIVRSIGGYQVLLAMCPKMPNYSPQYVGALQSMGLTEAKAFEVVDALREIGIYATKGGQRNSKAEQATAKQVLINVGGVACPAKRNRGRGRRRRW